MMISQSHPLLETAIVTTIVVGVLWVIVSVVWIVVGLIEDQLK